jgi:hypothetical protein
MSDCPYNPNQLAKRKYFKQKKEFWDSGSDARVYLISKSKVLMYTDSWNKVLWLYELGIIIAYWGFLPDIGRWVIELPLLKRMPYEQWITQYSKYPPAYQYAKQWAKERDLYEMDDNRCSNWLLCPITNTPICLDAVCLYK